MHTTESTALWRKLDPVRTTWEGELHGSVVLVFMTAPEAQLAAKHGLSAVWHRSGFTDETPTLPPGHDYTVVVPHDTDLYAEADRFAALQRTKSVRVGVRNWSEFLDVHDVSPRTGFGFERLCAGFDPGVVFDLALRPTKMADWQVQDQAALEVARKFFTKELYETWEDDAGAPFAPDTLDAAARLRAHDAAEYERVCARVKELKHKVLREWKQAVKRAAKGLQEQKSQLVSADGLRFTRGQSDYRFGDGDCTVFTTSGEGDGTQLVRFARDIWPRHIYAHVEPDASGVREHGVRLEYQRDDGRTAFTTVSAAAFVDRVGGRRASAELARQGVQVYTGSDHHLAHALGAWSDMPDRPIARLVCKPGWHGRVYVNGPVVHGASDWFADTQDTRIAARAGRSGTLQSYLDEVVSQLTRPGLILAFGQSLAGALIEPLGAQPMSVHLYGPSSCGKSSAARVAASVWGDPQVYAQSWGATVNGLELNAETSNGACLILDELQRWRSTQEALGYAIHDLNSAKGRARMTSGGGHAKQRSWLLTTLSTGEVSFSDYIGDGHQGGHRVRGIDVPVSHGDCTADAAHSASLYAATGEHFGVVSDAWVAALIETPTEALRASWTRWTADLASKDSSAEDQRIAANLAIVATALEHARLAGLGDWSDDRIHEVISWALLAASAPEDRKSTPNERALELLRRTYDTQPNLFPAEGEPVHAPQILGYRKKVGPEDELWTSETLLTASRLLIKTGVPSARIWVRWCVEQGIMRRADNMRCNGMQRRWVVMSMSEDVVEIPF